MLCRTLVCPSFQLSALPPSFPLHFSSFHLFIFLSSAAGPIWPAFSWLHSAHRKGRHLPRMASDSAHGRTAPHLTSWIIWLGHLLHPTHPRRLACRTIYLPLDNGCVPFSATSFSWREKSPPRSGRIPWFALPSPQNTKTHLHIGTTRKYRHRRHRLNQ